MNYTFITERIATGGGIASKVDVDALVADGITHVIDMRMEFDDTTIGDPRIQILWLPQIDDGTPRPLKHYVQGIQFAYTALSAAVPPAKVLAHCAAGINRGPTMCYALLRAFGYTKDEAVGRIVTLRPGVNFQHIQNYLDSVEQALLLL